MDSGEELSERIAEMARRTRRGAMPRTYDSEIRARLALEAIGNPAGVEVVQIDGLEKWVIRGKDGNPYAFHYERTETESTE